MSERGQAIDAFLAASGWAGAEHKLLAADASFRRYERVTQQGKTAVLMDAPPPKENVRPFIHIAELLQKMGLSAPRILARDEVAGFLLLEDFGDRTFTRALAAGADEGTLYRLALDTLIELHRRWQPSDGAGLPALDLELLVGGVLLFTDWYLPAVTGKETPANLRADYEAIWRQTLAEVGARRDTLVLRDYHVDNLMILTGRQGIAACGLLDFQDAAIGTYAYDVTMLLRDARRAIPKALEAELYQRYLAGMPGIDVAQFEKDFALISAQRAARLVGLWRRLERRDNKPRYLQFAPRTWTLLEEALQHPALGPVKAWFDHEVPAELRRAP